MAFLFSVSGSLPGFISGKLVNPPVENVEVKDIGLNGAFGSESNRVFFSYSEWAAFAVKFTTEDAKDYVAEFDKDFFKEHNLAVADISMPDTAHSVYVESAEEKSNVLEIEYRLTETEDMGGAAVICYETVFAVTSKLVSDIEITRLDDVTIPYIDCGLVEKSYAALHSGSNAHLFSDYEEWSRFKEASDIMEDGFNDIYDEYFFIRYNLAVLSIGYGDARYTSQYVDSYIKDGVLTVEYYDLQQHPDEAAMPCEPVTETLFIVTDKSVTSVKPACLGKIGYQEPETGIMGIYTVDWVDGEENACDVFSDYESWVNYRDEKFHGYYGKSLEDALDKDFFLKNNLVAATVSLPSLGGESVYINSAGETGNKASIEYSLFRHTGVYPSAIGYNVILYAAAKNVTTATCTRVEYPYPHEGVIATVDASGGNKEEILLFKDYESWQNFKKTTDWQFSGYDDIFDEEYFKHSRLIIAFIELPSTQHDIDWVESEVCGSISYGLTEPEGETDGKKHYRAVIWVACNRADEAHLYLH